MRPPAIRMRPGRAATALAPALAAVLALAACETVGIDSLDPFADGADETGAAAEAPAEQATGPADAGSAAAQDSPGTGDAGSETDADDADPDEADPAEADPDPASGAADQVAATDAQMTPAAAADAPHVYMSLQPDVGGQTSVVFAIDRSRDGTPSDEPAIRITPEATEAQAGRCNPQQLRYYDFPAESADRPVYGPDEASRGVGARDLPGFMATAVSAEMMERGIAEDLDGTRPQNVCTRKLFEQTIIAATTGQG